MKKIKCFISVLFLLSVMTISVISVHAEILPVKYAWVLDEDFIVALRENGDLLLGNSIDTETPELLAQNVIDFKFYERSRNFEHRSYLFFILHENGDITKIFADINDNTHKNFETEKLKVNAKVLYTFGDSVGYINNNNEFYYVYSNPNVDPVDKHFLNIRKTFDSRSNWDVIYAISTDNILYVFKQRITGKTQRKQKL